MSNSDSDSSYQTALDAFDREEFELPVTLTENGSELDESQKEFDLAHFEERERANGQRSAMEKISPRIFKTGRMRKAKNNVVFLSRCQYQRFRDEIKTQYLLSIQQQNSKFLETADLAEVPKGYTSLKDSGDRYDTPEERLAFPEENDINVQSDPWRSGDAPSILKDTDNYFSFEDSFVCHNINFSRGVKVEQSAVMMAVTVQPTSLRSSIEQFEDEANLLEDAVEPHEPHSAPSWFRVQWDRIRKTCCSICICTE